MGLNRDQGQWRDEEREFLDRLRRVEKVAGFAKRYGDREALIKDMERARRESVSRWGRFRIWLRRWRWSFIVFWVLVGVVWGWIFKIVVQRWF